MESISSEMQKVVFIYAGCLAKSHNLPMNDELSCCVLGFTEIYFRKYNFDDLMFDDKIVAVLMQIGKERIGRTSISSSAAAVSDSVQNVEVVDRGSSPEVLKDDVVFLKVIGDAIDVNIINEGAPQCSLPMDTIDLIVCVSGSFDSLAAKKLNEFLRVLKPGSDIFLLQKSASESVASSRVEQKLVQAKSVEEKLLQAGFQVLQSGQMKAALQTELFKSIEIKARKKSILELDDGDLIDKSNLIDEEEEERQRPVYPPVPDPQPGRYQAECTSERCGLGDAFRCRTCPYRGCPPGEPGVNITPNFPPPPGEN